VACHDGRPVCGRSGRSCGCAGRQVSGQAGEQAGRWAGGQASSQVAAIERQHDANREGEDGDLDQYAQAPPALPPLGLPVGWLAPRSPGSRTPGGRLGGLVGSMAAEQLSSQPGGHMYIYIYIYMYIYIYIHIYVYVHICIYT